MPEVTIVGNTVEEVPTTEVPVGAAVDDEPLVDGEGVTYSTLLVWIGT